MQKPVTGQYECQHRPLPVPGLDSLTGRVDRLILLPNGRFVLLTQERSRLAQAAQSLLTNAGPAAGHPPVERRREGQYLCQGRQLQLLFDDGSQAEGHFAWNGEGVQLGQDFFQKVSDSTFLPSAQRLKQEMEELARGLKVATTLGSLAVKAARALQSAQTNTRSEGPAPSAPPPRPVGSASVPSSAAPIHPAVPPSAPPPSVSEQSQAAAGDETFFCDQCGARVRPGKRYCGQCGALLP
ncbi:zinc ribbon domain-containing protein [Thermogemmatispora sp.]|uniref:zinc ribbon domain-containing protein n=1 Tax=Thermogemmatispora sp. TaxID=1968838 RepID=UPI0035E40203